MKIWCETCNGKGIIGNINQEDTCFNCNGKGYTENETIEHESEIGRATDKAFGKDGEFEINLGTHNTFYSVNELVEYFKED